jgi:hypothetical protein
MKTNYLNLLKSLLVGFATSIATQNLQAQITVQTFSYSGTIGSFTVPPCVTTISMDVRGAQGGFGNSGTGGLGARMTGVFTVIPGQVLRYLVGQCPGNVSSGSFTFPGGGGGSFVANGASIATSTPMCVAGGGGGGYGTTGDNAPITTSGTGGNPGINGNGAPSSSCGGGGGGFFTSGGADINYGFPGGQAFQLGGAGALPAAAYLSSYQPGGFGGGTAANYVGSCNLQGGNGGGYSGGSGYGTALWQAGTAGGSFNAGTNQANTAGFNSGNGLITFSYTPGAQVQASASPTAICTGNTATLTANNVTSYTWFPQNTVSPTVAVNPTSNTTYTVLGLNAAGCTTSLAITLTVSPSLPSLTVTASSNTVCLGQTAMLTAAGALTYTWTNGITNAVTFTPSATNAYTVTGGNGCGTITAVNTITVAPIAVNVVANPTTICSGYTSTLTATAAATTFSWFPTTQTGSNTVVSPLANIIYTIAVSNGTCGGTQTLALNVLTTPTISVAASATRICQGEQVSLTATGAGANGTYTWAPTGGNQANITVTPTASTIYTASGTNVNSCASSSQTFVIVDLGPNATIAASKTLACVGQTVSLTAAGGNSYLWSGGPNTAAQVITVGNGPSSYSVLVGHATNTCTTLKSIGVTGITPTVVVTPSTAICVGNAATLTASGASTYTWSGFAPGSTNTVSPSSNTTYTVAATTQSLNAASQAVNCSVTAVHLVVVNSLPTLSVTLKKVTICKNESNTLTVSGASTYSWSNASTGATVVVSPTITANYTVTGTDANGCSTSTVVQAKVSNCNSISEFAAENNSINVFPNPTSGVLYVNTDKDLQLQLINSIGEVVREIYVEAGQTKSIDVKDLSAGIYVLSGDSSGSRTSVKVIITR